MTREQKYAREERGHDADHERLGEALNLGAPVLKEDHARDERRELAVEDAPEGPAEALVDRGRGALLPNPQLLPDAFVDQHVGVDRHADRQGDARDPR